MLKAKKVLILFSAAMLALFSSCNFNNLHKKSATLVFDFTSVSGKVSTAARSTLAEVMEENETCYLDLEIQGGFEYNQTINLKETQIIQITDIPVGARITALADLYTLTINEDDATETKTLLYQGKSKGYTIIAGENNIQIPLKKYKPADDPAVDPDDEKDPAEDPNDPNDPNGGNGGGQQDDGKITIWVSYDADHQGNYWNEAENKSNEDPANDGTTKDTGFYYIQSAIDWIEVNGDGSSDYKIILTDYSATTAFDQSIEYGDDLNYKANSITITSNDKENFAIRSSSYKTIDIKTINGYSPVHLIFKDIKISTNSGVIIYGEDNLRESTKITLDNNTVFKGEEGNDGAICLAGGGTVEMRGNSRIETFHASQGGAAYIRYGSFNMYDTSSIYKCTANKGGAFYFYQRGASATLNNQASITECEASSYGGAIYMFGGSFSMNDSSSITGCQATNNGGAIYMDTTSNSPAVYLSGGEIKSNTAQNGAAIYREKVNGSASTTVNISDGFEIDESEIYQQ